ncbi:hypothetical protein BDA99DRAFT_572447 [Phascolomyces articulosus]|uniref:Uncharacterized protein n=1 Tax=Phascolomyces articulosus TaxID=60185 RepID=A0AAD5JZ98_9FUNG|nr:hypothetical protein BDA99DRAFT_572447 [Phascolomyces articulosus]
MSMAKVAALPPSPPSSFTPPQPQPQQQRHYNYESYHSDTYDLYLYYRQQQQQIQLGEQFVLQMRFSRLSVRASAWDMDVVDAVHNNWILFIFLIYFDTLLLIPLFIPAVLLDTHYRFLFLFLFFVSF